MLFYQYVHVFVIIVNFIMIMIMIIIIIIYDDFDVYSFPYCCEWLRNSEVMMVLFYQYLHDYYDYY